MTKGVVSKMSLKKGDLRRRVRRLVSSAIDDVWGESVPVLRDVTRESEAVDQAPRNGARKVSSLSDYRKGLPPGDESV